MDDKQDVLMHVIRMKSQNVENVTFVKEDVEEDIVAKEVFIHLIIWLINVKEF